MPLRSRPTGPLRPLACFLALALAALAPVSCKSMAKVTKGDYRITISAESHENLHGVYLLIAAKEDFEGELLPDSIESAVLKKKGTYRYWGEFVAKRDPGDPLLMSWEPLTELGLVEVKHEAPPNARELTLRIPRSFLLENKEATVLIAALMDSYAAHKIDAADLQRKGHRMLEIHANELVLVK